MSKLKIAVVGAGGRVGNELLRLIQSQAQCDAWLGIGRQSVGFKHNFKNWSEVKDLKPDVLIDFSSPALFSDSVNFCLQNKVPIVSGTTGISDSNYDQLKKASNDVPALWSPNMSLGIAMFKKCLQGVGENPDFDVILEEWHHNQKKDSPSGTLLMIQKTLEKIIKVPVKSVTAFRAGGIFGVHKVHLVSNEEHLIFEHTALNRAVFAKGAIVAAKWLVTKQNGLYSIDDVLSGGKM